MLIVCFKQMFFVLFVCTNLTLFCKYVFILSPPYSHLHSTLLFSLKSHFITYCQSFALNLPYD